MERVALISGASRGIGAAIARRLAATGWRLALGVRSPDTLTGDLAPSEVLTAHRYDALDRGAAARWIAEAIEAHGRIDALVNNAGIAPHVGLEDGDDEVLDELFDVNVKAPFRVIRAALPHLKASGQGRVINLASLSGKRVLGLNVGYQMSKHAVVALTHAVRRVGWPHGIRATALCPGYVDTDLIAGHTELPAGELIRPEDLARMVELLLTLPNSASIAELLVNGRYETTL
ncbi:MAG TPA: SDR family NAD(P)-dependent oxidoreductase [Aliidongia sp.]|uniref:SDR family NAD(P)-dependent oxidoreductase n=1 Tax=Aliidongia sp. TaxID=1914230 RepID=UPI002DDCB4B5|nr:SDR family NAD(P)-dependent oxidoreductase [Aliidongia sp.]HEV2674541.1 SDR family NAD(P)-dependent oxidoreductase [Aliidongia sp.]